VAKYIYQHPKWPEFTWRDAEINRVFGEVRQLQGKIIGYMDTVGFAAQEEANLATLTRDVVDSSEIEGEKLNQAVVRSSIARKLGIDTVGLNTPNRNIDGIVDMLLDATHNHSKPLTTERLCGWHAALFPTGHSGLYPIEVGRYRSGEMQIVSGAMGKEALHYEAIPAAHVHQEMEAFLTWFNLENGTDYVLKAAIAHFWFIIIHPFDDGNGRMARAISDMLLARADRRSERFYSMSSQMLVERKQYYTVLQRVQVSSGDITEWMHWFLNCLLNALKTTERIVNNIADKHLFWQKHAHIEFNERQRLVLNKLLDGFEGKLRTSKWAKMAKCSSDTALRDIKDLLDKGILRQEASGGRSTHYTLVSPNTDMESAPNA